MKNPLWMLGVMISVTVITVLAAVFYSGKLVNIPMLFYTAIIALGVIMVYSGYRTNKGLHYGEDFTKLTDKEKYLDLLEDSIELESKANYIARRAARNTEKLQSIGKELFSKGE
jgi:hypothetical protein